jgi:5-methylcytosine-specific restriction endonuclease McrA
MQRSFTLNEAGSSPVPSTGYGTVFNTMPTRRKDESREDYNCRMRLLMADRHAERRQQAIKALGGRCKQCGSKNDLQFDHIDPESKAFPPFKGWPSNERFWKEVSRCQLLCPPCHEVKTCQDAGKNRAKGGHGSISSYRYCHCTLCKAAKAAYSRKLRAHKRERDVVVA